ncbi:eukaryotic translation initiation factor 4E-binding protein Mextli isoform X3 [Ischnura elegans]|nr:eukaryotic translation initiation factor 4E-binding protein Mextli isoform X3 [Ischnura elegans]XP_046403838.1 eukaryotic translation initiation factor 4E-binding protein Mextli isoform X3 [Ischnura elegans]
MSIKSLARLTKTTRNLEKPRPLKLSNINRHSTFDGSSVRLNSVEEIMHLIDCVAASISNGNLDVAMQGNVINMCNNLKAYGQQLETIYKDQLDRAFVTFRNGCREEQLDILSRLHLLEIIELRAMQWQSKDTDTYYKQKLYQLEAGQNEAAQGTTSGGVTPTTPNPASTTPSSVSTISAASPTQTMLGQGEVVKSSGKYSNPTKIPNKNYFRDEVVIRNSDSGKVMGIKGRRVHMIEELSETIISFQRVHPGAKERLVQITGPNEEKILHATQLIEETIRRNASPTRAEMPDHGGDTGGIGGSIGSSINSSASEDNILRHDVSGAARRAALAHSYSTNDANIGEYKYTVAVGSETIKIIGTNFDLVWAAKLSLDDLFSRGKFLGGGDGYVNLEDDANFSSAGEGKGHVNDVLSQRLSVGVGGGGEGTGGGCRQKEDEDSGATTSDSSEGTYVETPVPSKLGDSHGGVASGKSVTAECGAKDGLGMELGVSEVVNKEVKVVAMRQPLFPGSSKEEFQAANEDAVSQLGKTRRANFSKGQSKDADAVDRVTLSEDGGETDVSFKQSQPKSNVTSAPVEQKKQPERPTKIRYTNDFLLNCAMSPLSQVPPPNWDAISTQYPCIVRKVLLPHPASPIISPRTNFIPPPPQKLVWNPTWRPIGQVPAPLAHTNNPFYWKRTPNF